MLKFPITTEKKKNDVLHCLMKIWVLAEVIKQEWASDMDVKFTKPELNQFTNRIKADAEAIHRSLSAGPNYRVRSVAGDSAETLAGEMYRVVNHFTTMKTSDIKTLMDNLTMIAVGEMQQPEQLAIDVLRELVPHSTESLKAWVLGPDGITIKIGTERLKKVTEALVALEEAGY